MKFYILFFLFFFQASFGAFSQNNHRYMSGIQLLQSLEAIGIATQNCHPSIQNTGQYDFSALGTNNTVTGQPNSASPSIATINWIGNCVSLQFQQSQGLGYFLKRNANVDSSQWRSLSMDSKLELLKKLMTSILGPDELVEDFGLIQSPDKFRMQIVENADSAMGLADEGILKSIILTLILRDEFLSY